MKYFVLKPKGSDIYAEASRKFVPMSMTDKAMAAYDAMIGKEKHGTEAE